MKSSNAMNDIYLFNYGHYVNRDQILFSLNVNVVEAWGTSFSDIHNCE